jgi:hypothetical protein
LKARILADGDAPRVERRRSRGVEDVPGVAERHEASGDCNGFATAADPVTVALEAVHDLRRAGGDARELRRALRRVEELLDE